MCPHTVHSILLANPNIIQVTTLFRLSQTAPLNHIISLASSMYSAQYSHSCGELFHESQRTIHVFIFLKQAPSDWSLSIRCCRSHQHVSGCRLCWQSRYHGDTTESQRIQVPEDYRDVSVTGLPPRRFPPDYLRRLDSSLCKIRGFLYEQPIRWIRYFDIYITVLRDNLAYFDVVEPQLINYYIFIMIICN